MVPPETSPEWRGPHSGGIRRFVPRFRRSALPGQCGRAGIPRVDRSGGFRRSRPDRPTGRFGVPPGVRAARRSRSPGRCGPVRPGAVGPPAGASAIRAGNSGKGGILNVETLRKVNGFLVAAATGPGAREHVSRAEFRALPTGRGLHVPALAGTCSRWPLVTRTSRCESGTTPAARATAARGRRLALHSGCRCASTAAAGERAPAGTPCVVMAPDPGSCEALLLRLAGSSIGNGVTRRVPQGRRASAHRPGGTRQTGTPYSSRSELVEIMIRH